MGVNAANPVVEIWNFCTPTASSTVCTPSNCDPVSFYEHQFALICLLEPSTRMTSSPLAEGLGLSSRPDKLTLSLWELGVRQSDTRKEINY